MNKFRVITWYLGVLIVSLTLILSFVTQNWLLAVVCAVVTFVLKSKNEEVELPKIYREKGISKRHFNQGANYEKNNK